jgi:hypothetical protein
LHDIASPLARAAGRHGHRCGRASASGEEEEKGEEMKK